MNEQPLLHNSAAPRPRRAYGSVPTRVLIFAAFVLLLSLCFFKALSSLTSLALYDELHSHVLLVPFIAAYLLYIIRDQLPKTYCSSFTWAILALTGGTTVLIIASARHTSWLTMSMLAFLCYLAAGGFVFLGKHWMKAATFPFAFLLFMIPLPGSLVQWLENASKLASADCASFLLHLTGVPLLRDGTIFQLPGIILEVAQECSGIRSSLVLLISSILASYLFLTRPFNRLILILVAIPLGVLRNGFRIAVIGLLCVRYGPSMIHSVIHRSGGPLFFVLSLIPSIVILWTLRRNERGVRVQKKTRQSNTGDESGIFTSQ